MVSGWPAEDAPFDAPVDDSFSELITDPELAERNPLDCDALGLVASGASMLLVLLKLSPVVIRVAVVPSGNSAPDLFDS